MRTVSTALRSIAAQATPTYLPRYHSHPRSTCLASTHRMERYIDRAVVEAFANRAQVDPSKLPCLAQWKRDFTMETILIELRRYVMPQGSALQF